MVLRNISSKVVGRAEFEAACMLERFARAWNLEAKPLAQPAGWDKRCRTNGGLFQEFYPCVFLQRFSTSKHYTASTALDPAPRGRTLGRPSLALRSSSFCRKRPG